MYKFGIRVPRGIHEALALYKEYKTDLWKAAIKKVKTIRFLSFKFSKLLLMINRHLDIKEFHVTMIFDVKFDGRRTTRLVAGSETEQHQNTPKASTPDMQAAFQTHDKTALTK